MAGLLADPAQGTPPVVSTDVPFYVPHNDLQLSGQGGSPTETLNCDLYLDAPNVLICIGTSSEGGGSCDGGVEIDFHLKGGLAVELASDESGHIETELPFPAIVIDSGLVLAGAVEAGLRTGFVGQFELDGNASSIGRAASGYQRPENVAFEFSPPEPSGNSALAPEPAYGQIVKYRASVRPVPLGLWTSRYQYWDQTCGPTPARGPCRRR